MQRVLKSDGIIAEKRNREEKQEDVSADDIRQIKAYVEANRDMSTPFDVVLNGSVADLGRSQLQDKLLPLIDAGATWWIEGLWSAKDDDAVERIRRGPPSREM